MVDAEVLIGHLRDQMKQLQDLIHYLENRERVGRDEFSYSQETLRVLIRRMKELERFSQQRSAASLHAAWLN